MLSTLAAIGKGALDLFLSALKVLLDCLKTLLDPKVVMMVILGGVVGFNRGCADEHERFEAHLQLDEARTEAQSKINQFLVKRNDQARQETENELNEENDLLTGLLADAEQRLHDNEQHGFLPDRPSTRKPVQPLGSITPGERLFLDNVYSGDTLCYAREYLDQGIRDIAQRARERRASLAQQAVDAIRDAGGFGSWADKVDACPIDASGARAKDFLRPDPRP